MPEQPTTSAADQVSRATLFRKKALLPLLALGWLLLVLAAIYWQLEPTDSGSTDTGIYFSGAESLAEGRGYKFVAYVNDPSITLYPPAQAAYLSMLWRINPKFPDNIPFLYCGMIFLAVVVVGVLCAYWWRERMPWPAVGLLIATWSLSPLWCWQLGTFFSDVLFVLLWLGVAWCWMGATNWDRGGRWFATGVMVALMYLTRSAGLAPLLGLAGLAGWRVFHGRWRAALAYLPPALGAVIWWKLVAVGNATYADTFHARLIEEGGWNGMFVFCGKQFVDYANGAYFFRGLFPWLMKLPGTPGWPAWGLNTGTAVLMVCGWAFMALWIWGWWRSRTKMDRLLGVMVFAFLAEHVVWPFDVGEKAVFSVLPFILLWAWRGVAALRETWPATTWTRWTIAGFVAAGALGNITNLPVKSFEWSQHNHLAELSEIGFWTRTHTPANATVAVSWTHPVLHFHHYSKRMLVQDERDAPWEQVVLPSSQRGVTPDYLLCSAHKPLKEGTTEELRFRCVKESTHGFYRLYQFVPEIAGPTRASTGFR